MPNLSRPWSVLSLFFCLLASPLARAQQAAPETPLDRQLSRIKLGVMGVGVITKTVSGTNYLGQHITQDPSSTVGIFVNASYTGTKWFGLEANFSQARYTQNFNVNPGGVQTRANEYSFGYLIHPVDNFFGFKPFVSGGAGTMPFHPTRGGGEGLPYQYRAVYYYNVGVDRSVFSEHFGIRASFRQAFYKAPDFLTNYLTIQQHTNTIEPGFGFYLRF
jgi:Outer membrane protein beta-barrel domain